MSWILGIDPTAHDRMVVVLQSGSGASITESLITGERSSERYLAALQAFFEQHDVAPKDLNGIVTKKGPGPFTGLRVGVTIANALAFGLGIPHVGEVGEPWYTLGYQKILAGKSDGVVQPDY